MMSRIALSLVAVLVAGGCNENSATAPASSELSGDAAEATSLAQAKSFPRSGALHITKECSQYTGLAGGFCTITSSSLAQIPVGTRVVYDVGAGATVLDTDITLDTPGPGNNAAFGHCRLEFLTGKGVCTFAGGTGKFTHFDARVSVTSLGQPNWAWEGTYSFDPRG